MSHELTTQANGLIEMAYAGETPWHGLGQVMQAGAPREQWEKDSGMDFEIHRSRVRYGEGANQRIYEDKHVLFRSDTKDALSVVSSNFKIVQPKEIFNLVFDLINNNGLTMETAGTLFGGRRFWALARMPGNAEVVPGDMVGGYLLVCTGADGTLATTGKHTIVRVVCNNTLSIARAGGGKEFRQTHRSVFDAGKMKIDLGLAREDFDAFAFNMKRLSDKTISTARAERLTFELLKPARFEKCTDGQEKAEIIEKVSDSRAFKAILALFDGGGRGSQMKGVKDTAWGYVNAVTEYADFAARATSQDNRLNSSWFGPGNDLKNRAVELVTAL
jgi:phage/plasmid-like protein (TIGR03299 family)